MSRYKYPFIIKDSSQNLYKFSMNEKNDLILEKFYENIIKTRIILKEDIRNFVVDIDDRDVIHVIYVDKNNSIKYSIYSTELINNNFFDIKDENNDYRFLFLKFIMNKLHLFFITRSLNDSQCILKSCIIVDNKLTVESILTVSCSKYICPYFIYDTTDYIYILYSKDSDENYIIYILDIHKNKWYNHSNIITLKNASHINFFVTNSTALICYNSFKNNNMELHLTTISLKISSKLTNEQTLSSNTNFSSIYPLILTSENHTFILWEEGEKTIYCNFVYDESFIVKKQYIPIEKSEIHFANYKSNFSETLKINNTIAYTLKENFLKIITDFQNITSNKGKKFSDNTPNDSHKDSSTEIFKQTSIFEEISSDTESISYTPINLDFLEITPYLNNYIKELYSSDTDNAENLKNYVKKNKSLSDEVDYLTRLNSTYKSRIEDLKNRFIKYRSDSAAMLMKYKEVIDSMETEKKKLISMMGEKDSKILSLQNIVNSNDK